MQTCFFAIAGVLPRDEAIARIKDAIATDLRQARPGGGRAERRGRRPDAGASARGRLPERETATRARPPMVAAAAPDFVQRVTAVMLAHRGDALPVSAFPVDGTWPTGTREVGEAQPGAGNSGLGFGPLHPVQSVRVDLSARRDPRQGLRRAALAGAPSTFASTPYRAPDLKGMTYTIQVAPEDCTGCHLCAVVCPAKDKANPRHKALEMRRRRRCASPKRPTTSSSWPCPSSIEPGCAHLDAKHSQFLEPLFEYLRRLRRLRRDPVHQAAHQLFGDRMLIANATGCSSIYGGNLPTTPYTTEPRRTRAGVVELAVRGQRRVRPRLPPRRRRAARPRRGALCAG
jgi:pyruvate-ferredoxin/flavodoxin oxidoreductase